jgi:hypothetical protein
MSSSRLYVPLGEEKLKFKIIGRTLMLSVCVLGPQSLELLIQNN